MPKPGEVRDILNSSDEMRWVVTPQAQRFGAQQHRAPPAGEVEKPEAEGDKRHGRGAELPLIEAGKDLGGLLDFIEKAVERRTERNDAAENARCEQDGPLEVGLVLIHRSRFR
jgi:hypothetical protein